AKCTLLIEGDSLSQAGIAENDRTCTGVTGTKFLAHRDVGSTNFKYGTNNENYRHRFYDMPGQTYETNTDGFVSDFTIKIPNVEAYGVIMYAPYYFEQSTITLTHESGLNSYQGTVKLVAGEKFTGLFAGWTTSSDKVYSATVDVSTNSGISRTISVSNNQSDFEALFPVNLGDSYHDKVTHKTENEGRAHFKNEWWNPRSPKDTDGNPIETDTYKEKDSFKKKEGE
ncbi:MAG: hypothetical protein VZR56_12310, partial [Treponema sp.]|nr:hypothetical protein [Treponema sp.]